MGNLGVWWLFPRHTPRRTQTNRGRTPPRPERSDTKDIDNFSTNLSCSSSVLGKFLMSLSSRWICFSMLLRLLLRISAGTGNRNKTIVIMQPERPGSDQTP